MNDQQLAQLFASQKIPPASEAARATALNAAMSAFAAQNIAVSLKEPALKTDSANDIKTTKVASHSDKKTLMTFLKVLIRRYFRGSRKGNNHPESTHPRRFALNSQTTQFSGWAMVAGLHLAVVIALMIGLKPKDEFVIVSDVKIESIEEQQVMSDALPPPPPDYVPPPPDWVPPPDFNVTTESVAAAPAMSSTQAPPAPATAIASRTSAKPPKKGLTSPDYPSESKKLGEQGVVTLALYLGEDGKVQVAQIETSSGFPRLDTAATTHAKSWIFQPCKDGDQPVACWHKINFRFQLKN